MEDEIADHSHLKGQRDLWFQEEGLEFYFLFELDSGEVSTGAF